MAVAAASLEEPGLQEQLLAAGSPFAVLALTLDHAQKLDFGAAATALHLIAQHPRSGEVTRDMRLARLLFDVNAILGMGRKQLRPGHLARCATAFAALGSKHVALLYRIGAEVARRVHEFKPAELVMVLVAFSRAGVRDEPLLDAVTLELTRSVSELTTHEIGDIAWAVALLRFRNAALLSALTDSAMVAATARQHRGFVRDVALAKVVWCLDAFGQQDLKRALVQSILDNVAPEGALAIELAYALSTAALSPDDMATRDTLPPLVDVLGKVAAGEAVTAAELRGAAARAPHLGFWHTASVLRPLGIQVHAPLGASSAPLACNSLPRQPTRPGIRQWVADARELLEDIFREPGSDSAFPASSSSGAPRSSLPVVDDSYGKKILEFGVDNFGKVGGRCLLNQIGVCKAEDNWVANAKQYIAAWANGVGKRPDDWKAHTVHRRIYVFAEFHISSSLWPMAELLEGISFHLNGLHSDPEAPRKPWLRSASLPISKWVDRSLCAEFQLMLELCDMIDRTGLDVELPEMRHSVYGYISMYLSEPSCVSCTGAMKQFLTLFPGVDFYVDCGSVVEPLMARTEMDLGSRQRRQSGADSVAEASSVAAASTVGSCRS